MLTLSMISLNVSAFSEYDFFEEKELVLVYSSNPPNREQRVGADHEPRTVAQ